MSARFISIILNYLWIILNKKKRYCFRSPSIELIHDFFFVIGLFFQLFLGYFLCFLLFCLFLFVLFHPSHCTHTQLLVADKQTSKKCIRFCLQFLTIDTIGNNKLPAINIYKISTQWSISNEKKKRVTKQE